MLDSNWKNHVEEMFMARAPLIVIETMEEERAMAALRQICQNLAIKLNTCDLVEGMGKESRPASAGMPAKDPLSLLGEINKSSADAIDVLNGFHEVWNNPQVKRCLRNTAQRNIFIRKSMVVICPFVDLPRELEDVAVVIQMPLPTPQELNEELTNLLRNPEIQIAIDKLGRERLIQSAAGLTAAQAQRAFARAIIKEGILDDHAVAIVLQEKKRIIQASKALEFVDFSETPETVGGLILLKQWLELRRRAFTQDARDFKLPTPKGIALIGIPGAGKSLTAKMVASMWQVPLLRLDFGSIFDSLVGASEAAVRKALRIAEVISPCILWIDEIDKAFSQGDHDGGTSKRVFGTILTWMQEKTAPCFVVATANNIANLPPELLRKGRFDEVFFIDLPNQAERKEIFSVHLKKRGEKTNSFNLDLLAETANGYVGAEIESAINDARWLVYNQAKRELKTADIVNAIRATVPLSVSEQEKIEKLRQWLRDGRARAASAADDSVNSNLPAESSVPIAIRPKVPTPKKPRNSSGGSP